jgi:hypothetical protein
MAGEISFPDGTPEEWPVVVLDGVRWLVAPVPIAPVSRDEVEELCARFGAEVPTTRLVDAIWRQADLRLDPWKFTRSPFTPANAQSPEAFADQKDRITRALAGRRFEIVVGPWKDFARRSRESARVDLYGWHQLDGHPIQPWGTSHNGRHRDYSQGFRPVVCDG